MKYCSKCGTRFNGGDSFCQNCGAPESAAWSKPETPIYSMKWYKFLIYFLLFFTAVIDITYGINYISGGIYELQSKFKVTADSVYRTFGMGLKITDVIYGVALIGLGIFAILTRRDLKKFKSSGPKKLITLYVSSLVVNTLCTILACIIIGNGSVIVQNISNFIASAISIYINYTYFSRRASLFVN